MFNAVEQALGEVDRSNRVATVSRAEMLSLVQTKFVVDTTGKLVLSNPGFIITIANTIGMMMDTAVDE